MRRHWLGLIAAVALIAGGLLRWSGVNSYVANSSLRIGIVLALLWLALPQLLQMKKWFYRAVIVVAVAFAAFSKYALILLPLLALMWFFGPRTAAGKSEKAPADSRR